MKRGGHSNEKHTAFYAKRLPVYLVVALIAISFIVGTAEAMFVPAAPQTQSSPLVDRAADLAKIQKMLESKALQQRLMDYGLSPANALAKINGLSDEQVHQLEQTSMRSRQAACVAAASSYLFCCC